MLVFILSFKSVFAEIGEKEFESIEKVSNHILTHYPREQYIYVGIGRSPVPIIAYLQSENRTLVRNVPLSKFQYGFGIASSELNPTEEATLFQHFDNYLPSNEEMGERNKILIIDFSSRATSIASAQFYLTKYIQSHRCHLSLVDGLAICQDMDSKPIKARYPALSVFPLEGSVNEKEIPIRPV